MNAELEDRVRELESELSYREAELFEARRDNAVLRDQLITRTAERDALHADLTAARSALRQRNDETLDLRAALDAADLCIARRDAQLAAARATVQWQPVGEQESYTYTDANGVMVYLEDRHYMELVHNDSEMVAILDVDHAFCRRNPDARVWQPVANGTIAKCACQDGQVSPRCTARLEAYELGLRYRNGDMADVVELPPGMALCELVTAGEEAES